MVKGWFTVRVELLSGRGDKVVPPPGRVFLVGPRHTFEDLAVAIDLGSARWDLGHMHEFAFPDGRRFGLPDQEHGEPVVDYRSVKVGQQVREGEGFRYVFDFGDNWQHHCAVEAADLEPEEVAGIVPRNPVAIFGWGWIPDQYGRRTEHDA